MDYAYASAQQEQSPFQFDSFANGYTGNEGSVRREYACLGRFAHALSAYEPHALTDAYRDDAESLSQLQQY